MHLTTHSHFLLPIDAIYREEPAANGHPAAAPRNHFSNVSAKPEYDFKSVPSSVMDSVNAELSDIDWSWHLRASNVNDALSHFSSILNSALEKQHLWLFGKQPYSHRCLRPSQPPWVDAHLRTAIKWKYDLYSIFKKYPTQQNKQAYQQQRNMKTLTRTKYRAYIRSVQTTLQGRHRPSLHQFVRQARIRNVSREFPSLTTGTQQAADPLGKATALNAQFASVTRPDDPLLSIPPILTPSEPSACFTSVITTTATVRCHLKKLPMCKASGPDGIPNRVLKALAPSIAFPLCHIFNMSFTTGIFPSTWKTAKVIPVFKKGSRHEPANYRPISLLPCVSKVCERIFYDHLYRHVSPFLSPEQSGFRKGDSTSLQRTRIVQQVCQHRDNRALAGICFFDLAKAFDTVWHRGLLAKLEHAFRVRKQPLSWLKYYLSKRYQYVTVLGTSSAAEPVLSGVPQGSIIGPLLFIIYANDLPAVFPGTSLFADDTTLLTSSASLTGLKNNLRAGIQEVLSWMSSWRLSPNLSKTKIMLFPPQREFTTLTRANFPNPIDILSSHKHLGIVIDSALSWVPHIEYICKKSSKSLGILPPPHCSYLPLSCKLLFYLAYLRPIFDCADTSSVGLSSSAAAKLEIHHKKILKILLRQPRMLSSSALYKIAHTTSLSHGRSAHLAFLVHSIKLELCPPHLMCFNWFSSLRTRNSPLLPKCNSSTLLRSPLFIAYSLWLTLPREVKDLTSLRLFKIRAAPYLLRHT